MITFVSPPGIGDTSWVISKIYHLFTKREVAIKTCDYPPSRTSPFIDMLPVKNLGYTPWPFPEGALPITTDLDSLEDGEYRLECNTALEEGKLLAHIFPHQPTNYHYELFIPKPLQKAAKEFIAKRSGLPRIGIYASAYTGPCPWGVPQWVEFCKLLRMQFPDAAFYVIGAKWDNRTTDIFNELLAQGFNVASAVGEHHIGTTISVLKKLDYFFCYPSGLGILADVVQTPCLMWIYREFPQKLIGSYQDPDPNTKAKHLNKSDQSVSEAFKTFTDYFLS